MNGYDACYSIFWSVIVFSLATQTWAKAPHWDGARVEVFALVYLQIVIIAAPIAVSYGDSVLVLDRKVQGIKWSASSSLLHRPWLAWVAVDVTDLDCCLPRSCLLVEMTWITCIKKLETCARKSKLHHTRRKVIVTSLERNHTCVSLYWGEWRVYHINPHHPDIYISILICPECTTYL